MQLTFRKARISDVETMYRLVNEYARRGLMLPRARSTFYEFLRDYTVVEADGKFLGSAALHILWEDLAEIRSLAIIPEAVGKGIGRALVEQLIKEACDLQLQEVLALTYQPEFFEKCGFTRVEKETLPQKVWQECIHCPQFPNCGEVALVRMLDK